MRDERAVTNAVNLHEHAQK